MSDERKLPPHLRRNFVAAASAFLEIVTKPGLRSDDIIRLNETHDMVVEALRDVFAAPLPISAISFRGKIFALAPRTESLVVMSEDRIRPIDG